MIIQILDSFIFFFCSPNGVRRRNNRKMAYPVTLPCYFWGEEIASRGFLLFWNKTNSTRMYIFIHINMVCTYVLYNKHFVCLATRHHSVILVCVLYTFLTSPCVSHLNRQNASARYFSFSPERKRILTQQQQQQQQDSNEIIWQVVKGCAPESSQLFFPRFSYIIMHSR